MATTTRYTWPVPDPSDKPEVHDDMRALANAVEESVGAVDDRLTTLTGLSQSVFQYTTLTRVSSNILTIPNVTWTPISFDAAQVNLPASTPGFVLASPTRITCQQTGIYRITGFAGFDQNASGSRAVGFRINGNPSYPAIQNGPALADMPWYGSVYVEAKVNKNDFLELVVRQASGGSLQLDVVKPRFSMQRLV